MNIPLPPKPVVNTDVPVITSAGGGSAAYKDPNSPESIMRKTTLTQAQSITDTRFDVPADAFMNYPSQSSFLTYGIVSIFILLGLVIVKKRSFRILLLSAVALATVLSLTCKKKNGTYSG